jgi:putative ABC transport system substrate-binding protein
MGFAEADPDARALVADFQTALEGLGWTLDPNLRMEVRWGAGDANKIEALAKELIALRPDAMLAQTTPAARALSRETKSIPIVFVTVSDPIGGGLAESLTHPGDNVTGFTFVEPAMGGKWVELLKEIAPNTSHTALLFNPATAPPLAFYMPSIEAAGASVDIEPKIAPVHAKDEIDAVIAAEANYPGGSLIVMPDAFNAANRQLIIASAASHHIPAIYGNNFVNSGGLAYYGANFPESFRLAAGYIDRILRGAKPKDLPIQLPTKFDLAINLKTAKALGLVVPPSLLARADEVIE